MLAKKLVFLLAASVAALPFMGCAAITGEEDSDEDHEEEPVGQSNDELRSAVSCKERTDTAYSGGQAHTIQVIHVGGKPTSKATGHAFLKMQAAAHAAGVRLSLTSGFRTNAEQKYLYNCYLSKRCNNGNLAARPGYSHHQNGLALDLSTSSWLTKNASRFGFVRTVPREAWHYEYRGADPGGPCSRGGSTTTTSPDDTSDDTNAPTGGDDDSPNNTPAEPTPAAGGLTWVAPAQDTTTENGFTVKAHANRPGIVKVVYNQGTFQFGVSTRADEDFALSYTFQYMGDKTLTARGYDASGALVAMDHVDFTLLP
jgi:hypothetical protein